MALLRTLDDQIRIPIRNGQTFLVGRIPACDVYLEDGSVSSQHARLKMEDNILQLHDLDSTNGTRVNYALVEGPTLVLDGDTVEFGNLTFTVDGPELQSPEEAGVDPKAMTSLGPIDASQALENTMQIHGLEEVPVEESTPAPTNSEVTPSYPDPVKVAFAAAFLLIGLAGAILLSGITNLQLP